MAKAHYWRTTCGECDQEVQVVGAEFIVAVQLYPARYVVLFFCDSCGMPTTYEAEEKSAAIIGANISKSENFTITYPDELDDVLRYAKLSPISLDDVIDAHAYLEQVE